MNLQVSEQGINASQGGGNDYQSAAVGALLGYKESFTPQEASQVVAQTLGMPQPQAEQFVQEMFDKGYLAAAGQGRSGPSSEGVAGIDSSTGQVMAGIPSVLPRKPNLGETRLGRMEKQSAEGQKERFQKLIFPSGKLRA